MKRLKVEVYLVEFKMCLHPHMNEIKIGYFSRACTIGKTTVLNMELLKVVVHVINIQHPRNVHFSNNYFITTAICITVWGKIIHEASVAAISFVEQ